MRLPVMFSDCHLRYRHLSTIPIVAWSKKWNIHSKPIIHKRHSGESLAVNKGRAAISIIDAAMGAIAGDSTITEAHTQLATFEYQNGKWDRASMRSPQAAPPLQSESGAPSRSAPRGCFSSSTRATTTRHLRRLAEPAARLRRRRLCGSHLRQRLGRLSAERHGELQLSKELDRESSMSYIEVMELIRRCRWACAGTYERHTPISSTSKRAAPAFR